MLRIARVKKRNDARGNVTHVTIIVKKHREAVPVRRKISRIEKAQFEKDCEAGITLEELGII